MKEHIVNRDEYQNTSVDFRINTLCGRDTRNIQSGIFTDRVSSLKKKKLNWCKTCKMLYNSNIANCHPDKVLK